MLTTHELCQKERELSHYYALLNHLGSLGFGYSSVQHYNSFTTFILEFDEYLIELDCSEASICKENYAMPCYTLSYTTEENDFEEIGYFHGNLESVVSQFFNAIIRRESCKQLTFLEKSIITTLDLVFVKQEICFTELVHVDIQIISDYAKSQNLLDETTYNLLVSEKSELSASLIRELQYNMLANVYQYIQSIY